MREGERERKGREGKGEIESKIKGEFHQNKTV